MTTTTYYKNLNLDFATNNDIVKTDSLSGNVLQNTGHLGNVDANSLIGYLIDNVTPNNGDTLIYNSGTTKWVPQPGGGGGGNGTYGDLTGGGSYGYNWMINNSSGSITKLVQTNGQTATPTTGNGYYIAYIQIAGGTFANTQFVLQLQTSAITNGTDSAQTNTNFLVVGDGNGNVTVFKRWRESTNSTYVAFSSVYIDNVNSIIFIQQQPGTQPGGSPNSVYWNINLNYVSPSSNTNLPSLTINSNPQHNV